MQRTPKSHKLPLSPALAAAFIAVALPLGAAQLENFQFNEGSGVTLTNSAGGPNAVFGSPSDPSVDYSALISASPSGAAGDRCITNSGLGFLMADDSATRVLDITNGPITLETWIFIDPSVAAKAAEGLIAYGNSYKMGMKGGYQVFTLFGKVDITNAAPGQLPSGQWVHLAAAWEPGVGVHFFMNGTQYDVADTNTVCRPVSHNYLSIGSEGIANNSVSALDRVRIHHAVLTASEVDSDPATPKGTYASTLVNYRFNESAFPCTSSLTPPLPTLRASTVVPSLIGPTWSTESPSGLPGDYSLAFMADNPLVKQFATANYGTTPIGIEVNNTNYTLQAWFKIPAGPIENRRVIYRTDGVSPRVSLSINATHQLHTTLYGNMDFAATTALVPDDNRWHHMAAVMEGFARVRFYLDGILRQTMNRTATAGPTGTANPNALIIGKESETLFFRGLLDRVLVNNTALTNATIDYPAIPGLPTFAALTSHPVDVRTNLGSTAKFTVTPTGATSIQWYYRTNLADLVGVLLSGQTGNDLVLTGITANQFGYYYAVVSNAVGKVESYAARLQLPANLNGKLIDFEPPTYVSGIVEGQDEWTNDQNGIAARVLTASQLSAELTAAGLNPANPVHSGNQALVVSGANLATTSIRAFTGLETKSNIVFDVWARPLTGPAIGNVFFTVENAAGTTGRAAGIRFGPGLSIDYGLVANNWVASGLIADPSTWYHFALHLNYTNRTYDFFVNDTQINSSPIPFYTSTSESFRQVRVFRGASQAGMIVDDMNVPGAVRITTVSKGGGNIVINWNGGTPPYQLQRRNSLTSGSWENVGSTTTATQATDTLGADPMYYRVGSD